MSRWMRRRGWPVLLWTCLASGLASCRASSEAAAPAAPADVFAGPVATYAPRPPLAAPPAETAEVLRWVFAEERVGEARRAEPVRTPLFFAAGEVAAAEELTLVRWPSREPVAWQVDDVRRAADGGVARLHAWFVTDLAAHETQRFAVLKTRASPASAGVASTPVPTATEVTDAATPLLRLQTGAAEAEFVRDGAGAGALRSLSLTGGPRLVFPAGATPRLEVVGDKVSERLEARARGSLAWGVGPVFGKVVARWRTPSGAAEVEQVYRLFRDGTLIQTQTVRPQRPGKFSVRRQELLRGSLDRAASAVVALPQPAVLEPLLADSNRYLLPALFAPSGSRGWLLLPAAYDGTTGVPTVGSELRLGGPPDLTRGEGDAPTEWVRAFWSELQWRPIERGADGAVAGAEVRRNLQPLVAVVELPGMSARLAAQELLAGAQEMKPVGWVNATALAALAGKEEPFPKRNWTRLADVEQWASGAREARRKATADGDLDESSKGKAAGSLDPYHITYGETALGAFLLRGTLPEPVRLMNAARSQAIRQELARTDELGWPYLDVFHRAQNMQMGPAFLAVMDPRLDLAVRQFFRDLLAAPHLHAPGPWGVRSYDGRVQDSPGVSDMAYQAIVEFYLRATEVVTGESVGFPRIAFGRHNDAIDVNADLLHPFPDRQGKAAVAAGELRSNFYRAQSHLHRWLSWGPAPFVSLLRSDEIDGLRLGATEAWFQASSLRGKWRNWPTQGWMILAGELTEFAPRWQPVVRLPAASEVRSAARGSGLRVTWAPVAGAASYRVYRLRPGAPVQWLNSPYVAKPRGAIWTDTQWDDRDGRKGDRYRIHAIDAEGRETLWSSPAAGP